MSGSLVTMMREIFQQKVAVLKDIKQFGFFSFLKKAYVLRETWWDKGDKVCVGTDQNGNTYWETTVTTPLGRNRWVEFKNKSYIFDASQVPAEWHMWLHRIREQPPSAEEVASKGRMWKSAAHPGNLTGTAQRYYPPGHFFNPKHRNHNIAYGTDPQQQQEVLGQQQQQQTEQK